jgi:hypothetical protein
MSFVPLATRLFINDIDPATRLKLTNRCACFQEFACAVRLMKVLANSKGCSMKSEEIGPKSRSDQYRWAQKAD